MSYIKLLAFVCLLGSAFAKDYYVCGTTGSDKNPGTKEAPLKTPSKAVRKLNSGDTLIIRQGRYHDVINGSRKWQDPKNPVTICAAEGEEVVFDGTVAIKDIADGKWERYKKGIWKIKIKRDIWQLFDKGETQTSARWPNAFWHDGSIWDQNNWASLGSKTHLKNREYMDCDTNTKFPHCDIAKAGFDATGAAAILNISNFDTYCERVTEHGKGQPRFKTTFNATGTLQHFPIMGGWKDGKFVRRFRQQEGTLLPLLNLFFLECSLGLLDAPTEWYYDKESKWLYYYPMDGKDPSNSDVRGKVQSYAIDMRVVKGIVVKGLNFFGTTVKFYGMGREPNCTHITVEDCDFRYPSYSKRMLGDLRSPEITMLASNQPRFLTLWKPRHFAVRNCTFFGTDGVGIWMAGAKNRMENCLFKEIDYSVIDPSNHRKGGRQKTFRGNDDTVCVRQSPGMQMHRVTVDTAGAAHSIPTGADHKGRSEANPKFGYINNETSLATYCRVINGGRLQVQDGGCFHSWQFDSDYGGWDHCWANDGNKWGFRFDGTYTPGHEAHKDSITSDHNRTTYCLAWNMFRKKQFLGHNYVDYGSGATTLQGNSHQIHHNTMYEGGGSELYKGGGTQLFIMTRDRGNKDSHIYNNLAGKISGSTRGITPFNGHQSNNYGDINTVQAKKTLDLKELLRDPDNLDFRPKASATDIIDKGKFVKGITVDVVGDAPDIGAYEYGCKTYWIPGYQAPGASTPIPPNNTKTAKPDLDLMWLHGYKATKHTVYFGSSKKSLTKLKTFKDERNICPTGKTLVPGKTYYWRVDTVDRFGKKLKGKIWRFKVEGTGSMQEKGDQ